VLQIVNNVAGAGILTLSAGVAAGVGWVPASALCLLLGAISGVTFHLIGCACDLTGETTFKGLWDATLGARSSWLVDASIALMCLSAAIIYAGILGDTSTSLLRLVGLPEALNRRATNIALLTIVALTPLSLLDDLSALAFTSLIGVLAVLYTACFIVCRSLDGSYALPRAAAAAGGRMVASLPAHLVPSFKRASWFRLDARALILVSNLGLAYIAHYNAPTFYRSLERPSTRRFGKVCAFSFGILSCLYLGIMLAGHRTFGDITAANILLNYAERDPLAVVGRAATFVSILFGFPLAMLGLKDALFSLTRMANTPLALELGPLPAMHVSTHQLCTLALLAAVATVAILVVDIGLVVGVSGALLGAAIVYIFPALIYGAALRQRSSRARSIRSVARPTGLDVAGHLAMLDKDADGAVSLVEVLIYLLVPLGAFLGLLGVYMTLAGA